MSDPKVLVTERGELDRDVMATTPPDTPNLRVVVMNGALRVLVRVVRVYLMSLIGFLGIAATGTLPTDPVAPLDAWQKIVLAAGLALYPAFVSLLWNALELLARVDEKAPEVRG